MNLHTLLGFCSSYCSHGGVCILPRHHEGQHDSEYCQWTDEEAISKEEADAKLSDRVPADVMAFLRALT